MIRDFNNILLPESLPKTAVIGANGYIGAAFLASYRKVHPDCIGTTRRAGEKGLQYLDLAKPDIAPLGLAATGHKAALILAAVTNIDQCEVDRQFTRKINVAGTMDLIRQLAEEGIQPVYFSSDYVFNGNRGRYSDNDCPDPTTEYGRQKVEVESGIPPICGKDHLIVRLSKIFTLEKGNGTLFDEVAAILASGGSVKAADDQIFCPTLLWDVISAVASIQAKGLAGTFNVCSPDIWRRYDLALSVAKKMGVDASRVQKISIDDLGFKAIRPKDISMVPKRLLSEIAMSFAPITDCIDIVTNEWRRA